jgi:hypothetical protein
MRHAITAPDDETYRAILDLVDGNHRDSLQLTLESRRLLAVEDLPEKALDEIRRMGADVVEDTQYGPDAVCSDD